jgi:3-hydroxybutyrate dehydrogenase
MNILITGAASGIGRALTQHFAARHRVVASDVQESPLRQLKDELHVTGSPIRTLVLDVADAAQVESAQARIADASPDVLINNAGLQHVAPLEEFPPQKWQQLVGVMLTGAALLTRSVVPGMRQRGYGRIVNVGSIHALVASPFKSAYVAAKHGLVGFSKAVALETADCDITINTICPSYVRTPLVDTQIDTLASLHGLTREAVCEKIMLAPMPKHAFITVEELAGTIDFLLSDAARNITGQCIAIDGGWTVQ